MKALFQVPCQGQAFPAGSVSSRLADVLEPHSQRLPSLVSPGFDWACKSVQLHDTARRARHKAKLAEWPCWALSTTGASSCAVWDEKLTKRLPACGLVCRQPQLRSTTQQLPLPGAWGSGTVMDLPGLADPGGSKIAWEGAGS